MVTITLELEDSFIHEAIEQDIDENCDAKELLYYVMNKMAFIDLESRSKNKDVMLFLNSNAIPDEHIDKFRSLVVQTYMLCRVSEKE